jgi:dTDP-4-amino-4,6-dideoxygalactose transaminase
MAQDPIPFLDLRAQYRSIQAEIEAAVHRVLDSQALILGPEVEALERELAERTGAAHGVAVASGTDAIFLALRSLGIGQGHEVVTSAFSFFATAGAVLQTGARPVFVDLEPGGFNLDPEQAAQAITPRTRALLPVHLFGLCADLPRLEALAGGSGLPVVEDAAQALGALCNGRSAGAMGRLGCLSFYPTKNLGGLGDGGLILTQAARLAERLRALRNHGQACRYEHRELGCNSRLDAIQAAALRVKLRHLDRWTEARRTCAARYRELFDQAGLAGSPVALPWEPPGRVHVYHQFVVRVPDREALQASLERDGVGTMVYYPRPLPAQPVLEQLGYSAAGFPRAVEASRTCLALPIYPELSAAQQERVVASVARHYGLTSA